MCRRDEYLDPAMVQCQPCKLICDPNGRSFQQQDCAAYCPLSTQRLGQWAYIPAQTQGIQFRVTAVKSSHATTTEAEITNNRLPVYIGMTPPLVVIFGLATTMVILCYRLKEPSKTCAKCFESHKEVSQSLEDGAHGSLLAVPSCGTYATLSPVTPSSCYDACKERNETNQYMQLSDVDSGTGGASSNGNSISLDLHSDHSYEVIRIPRAQTSSGYSTGGVTTSVLIRGFGKLEDNLDGLPMVRGCGVSRHILEVLVVSGDQEGREVKQQLLDATQLPSAALRVINED